MKYLKKRKKEKIKSPDSNTDLATREDQKRLSFLNKDFPPSVPVAPSTFIFSFTFFLGRAQGYPYRNPMNRMKVRDINPWLIVQTTCPQRDTDKIEKKASGSLAQLGVQKGEEEMQIIVQENNSEFVSFISFPRKWREIWPSHHPQRSLACTSIKKKKGDKISERKKKARPPTGPSSLLRKQSRHSNPKPPYPPHRKQLLHVPWRTRPTQREREKLGRSRGKPLFSRTEYLGNAHTQTVHYRGHVFLSPGTRYAIFGS